MLGWQHRAGQPGDGILGLAMGLGTANGGDLGLVSGCPLVCPISVPLHGWGIAPLPAHAAAVGILRQQQHDRATGPASYYKGTVNMKLMEPESRPFPRRVSLADVSGLVCKQLQGFTAGTGDGDGAGRTLLAGALAKGVWWLIAAPRRLVSALRKPR